MLNFTRERPYPSFALSCLFDGVSLCPMKKILVFLTSYSFFIAPTSLFSKYPLSPNSILDPRISRFRLTSDIKSAHILSMDKVLICVR